MRNLGLLLFAGIAAAAPMTPQKLQLIPGLYPNERRELARKLQSLMGKEEGVKEALVLAGVDERIATRLDTVYAGPLLVERYAHGLVMEAPGLTEKQKEILQHLHPSVLAAQWALQAQRGRLAADEALKESEALRSRLLSDIDRRVREMEKRYWRVVSYVLTFEQKVALHELMPQAYQRPPNIQQHVFMVPGLTPSQATRMRALITEYESETAADTAEIRRLQADRELDPRERQRRVEAATDRTAELLRGIVARSRKVLTPEQVRHLDALPPLISPNERRQGPQELLQLGLRAEQKQRIQALVEDIKKKAAAAQAQAKEKTKDMEGEMGSDSPQSMTMQMARQGADTARILAMEEAAHTACLEIVEKRQLLGWILSPPR